MKKYLAILLTAALSAMMLAGCGSSSGPQNGRVSGEAAPSEEPDTDESGVSASSNIFAPYYGSWEIKDYVTAEPSDMYTDEMEAYRGQTVTYQEDSILLNGEDVNAGSFTYEKDEAPYDYDELTEDYKVNLGEWWNNISEVTKVTVTSDKDFFGRQLFLADADTLWIYYEDAFFFAKRAEE